MADSPVSVHGFLQNPQNKYNIFVFVHENVQIAAVFCNRNIVLLDDATNGRTNRRM